MINDLVKLVIAHPKRYLKFKLINSLVLIATPRAQHPTVEPNAVRLAANGMFKPPVTLNNDEGV
ncbi:hypothetical protein [Vibrio sp.]|uniref:hypothetical protein n=1 Tax=Vibrio sp. TaxID=678 RepID=UPI0029C99672|nr:hypothetical protein [uncultured Vibrio sp.]